MIQIQQIFFFLNLFAICITHSGDDFLDNFLPSKISSQPALEVPFRYETIFFSDSHGVNNESLSVWSKMLAFSLGSLDTLVSDQLGQLSSHKMHSL